MWQKKLGEEILRIPVDIPIILCRGFSQMITEAQAKEIGVPNFQTKPLIARASAQAVRCAMNRQSVRGILRTGTHKGPPVSLES